MEYILNLTSFGVVCQHLGFHIFEVGNVKVLACYVLSLDIVLWWRVFDPAVYFRLMRQHCYQATSYIEKSSTYHNIQQPLTHPDSTALFFATLSKFPQKLFSLLRSSCSWCTATTFGAGRKYPNTPSNTTTLPIANITVGSIQGLYRYRVWGL